MADVLEISTALQPCGHASIDGVSYAIRSRRQLTLAQLADLRRLWPAVDRLANDKASDEDRELAPANLKAVCGFVLEAPADVQARLSDEDRMAVMNRFFGQWAASVKPALSPNGAAASPSRTTSSSRGSAGSTAARRGTGGRTSRAHS